MFFGVSVSGLGLRAYSTVDISVGVPKKEHAAEAHLQIFNLAMQDYESYT